MQLNAAALTSLDVCNERTGVLLNALRNPNWEIMPYAVFILPWVLIPRIDGETYGFSLMITSLLGMKKFRKKVRFIGNPPYLCGPIQIFVLGSRVTLQCNRKSISRTKLHFLRNSFFNFLLSHFSEVNTRPGFPKTC